MIDNAAEKRYELDLGDGMALAEYVLGHGLIVLTHTEVPPKYEGRGIGKELVQGVLEDIRKKEIKVVPQCPFVAAYIRRHTAGASVLCVTHDPEEATLLGGHCIDLAALQRRD